ncbi:helix-turn-helix domain-containing protein [Amycolatopsis sp.]|jgi:AcrR family transcriptional regulator|uniref:TetR/AcrR family transcriptional regulator n=1 Tax=Amycolatopsis sp. TaxID=37632 RepID=UPI002E01FEED|nr:helix-turn-helix domain-containing protein [Amycolatopsis sp.]
MARPKTPLISRRRALEAALEIVDAEGLDALSIRRLGDALNVNGASLYHHFKNKDDILQGVTQLALAGVTSPHTESDNWRVWLPLNAYRTRQALVAHPELIPVMLRRASLGIGAHEVEASYERLEQEGVALDVIAPLMELLELLATVSALQETGEPDRESGAVDGDSATERARQARILSSQDVFEAILGAATSAVETAAEVKRLRQNAAGAKAVRGTRQTPPAAGNRKRKAKA